MNDFDSQMHAHRRRAKWIERIAGALVLGLSLGIGWATHSLLAAALTFAIAQTLVFRCLE